MQTFPATSPESLEAIFQTVTRSFGLLTSPERQSRTFLECEVPRLGLLIRNKSGQSGTSLLRIVLSVGISPEPVRTVGNQDPGSRIQDPGSRILDPRSRILDAVSWIQDPGSKIPDPGSWIQGPGYSRILDPGSWMQDPGSWIRIQESESRSLYHGSRIRKEEQVQQGARSAFWGVWGRSPPGSRKVRGGAAPASRHPI